MFTHIAVVNDVYPVRLTVIPPNTALAAWTIEGDEEVPTHEELVERLEQVAMVATAKGANGTRATLMTWHRRLGHPSFKTVVALAKNGAKGMEIMDLPKTVPGLDACVACVAVKAVHFPHKEGCDRTEQYLGRVHIDIAGPYASEVS
jgi:hypothetical protein